MVFADVLQLTVEIGGFGVGHPSNAVRQLTTEKVLPPPSEVAIGRLGRKSHEPLIKRTEMLVAIELREAPFRRAEQVITPRFREFANHLYKN